MLKDSETGKAIMSGRVKIFNHLGQWDEYLNTARFRDRDILIMTYSLPKIESNNVQRILANRKGKTVLIYNSKFNGNIILQYMKNAGVKLIPMDDVHAKMSLISPDNVHIGSENFYYSGWYECGVSIKDASAYEYELQSISEYLGYNPFTGEPVKGKSCESCINYVWDKFSQKKICDRCYANGIDTENPLKCELFNLKSRKNYQNYRLNLDSYWEHSCKNCLHIRYAKGEGYNGFICPIASKYFPMIRKNSTDPDINNRVECRFWELGATHTQVE